MFTDKKFLLIVMAMLFLLGCGGSKTRFPASRKIQTPSERLVGHWTGMKEGSSHFYFSKTSDEKIGAYILVNPGMSPFNHQYQVLDQDEQGEKLKVKLLFKDGDSRTEFYKLTKDGLKLGITSTVLGITTTLEYKYVDDKEKP